MAVRNVPGSGVWLPRISPATVASAPVSGAIPMVSDLVEKCVVGHFAIVSDNATDTENSTTLINFVMQV